MSTFGDIPSYRVTSQDGVLYEELEYFNLRIGFTKKRDLTESAVNKFQYVNFWSKDGSCRGLHECPYEYDCTTKNPNTTITVSTMNAHSKATNNAVGCAYSSKSSNLNKNIWLIQGQAGKSCSNM